MRLTIFTFSQRRRKCLNRSTYFVEIRFVSRRSVRTPSNHRNSSACFPRWKWINITRYFYQTTARFTRVASVWVVVSVMTMKNLFWYSFWLPMKFFIFTLSTSLDSQANFGFWNHQRNGTRSLHRYCCDAWLFVFSHREVGVEQDQRFVIILFIADSFQRRLVELWSE